MSPPSHESGGHEPTLSPFENRVAYPHVASEADMRAYRLPLAMRDLCSQHAIWLRECHLATYYNPFRCHPEKTQWEICQYKDYLRRMRKATRLRLERQRDDTGPVPRIDEKFNSLMDLKTYFENQDLTPGKAGPYDMDDVLPGEKDGIRKTGH